jgi:hypothetical protein
MSWNALQEYELKKKLGIIDREINLQKLRGKETFKNLWIGDGWLSVNKKREITFQSIYKKAK